MGFKLQSQRVGTLALSPVGKRSLLSLFTSNLTFLGNCVEGKRLETATAVEGGALKAPR